MDTPKQKVKCIGCGFLAVRNKATRELAEVDWLMRHKGKFPNDPVERRDMLIHIVRPVCFKMESQLTEKAQEWEDLPANFKTLINEERNCDNFTEWRQGFTPKEHAEMILSDKMLELQQSFQADQAKLAEERHNASMKIADAARVSAEETARRVTWIGVAGAIVASLLAALVSAVLSGKQAPPVVNVQMPSAAPITADPKY